MRNIILSMRVTLDGFILILLGVPALLLIAVLPLPGALSAFRLPALSFWPTYLQGLTPLRFLAHLDKGSIYCYIRRQKQRSYGMMLQEISRLLCWQHNH